MAKSRDAFAVPTKVGKGKIKHKLKKIPKKKHVSAFQRLLSYCVLSRFEVKGRRDSILSLTRFVQDPYQRRCLDLIRAYGLSPLVCTYRCNCRPCGVIATPKTKFCTCSLVCPWCYIRRMLMPVFNAFRAVPAESRKLLRLSIWEGLPVYAEPARAREIESILQYKTGPARKLKASVSAYVAVVRGTLSDGPDRVIRGLHYPPADDFSLGWFGISATHVDTDVAAVLSRLSPQISVISQGVAFNDRNLLLMLAKNLYYPELLLKRRNIDSFHQYSQSRAGVRLLRIYKYKGNR